MFRALFKTKLYTGTVPSALSELIFILYSNTGRDLLYRDTVSELHDTVQTDARSFLLSASTKHLEESQICHNVGFIHYS